MAPPDPDDQTASPESGRVIGAIGVVVASVGLGLAAGLWGAAAGAAIGLAWYRLPASYAFAAGQVVAAAVLTVEDPLVATVTELGLLAVLAGALATTDEPVRTIVAFAVAALALGAVGWGVLLTGRSLWGAVSVVVAMAATVAYAVHRYERVSLGLVTDDLDERTRTEGVT